MSWVRATNVASAAERDRHRVERGVERTERRRLGDLADLAGRRVLTLGEAVDLVVEHDDLQAHVAAQRVDQVVAADRQHVAVAADHPHVEVGARQRDPGRHRGRPPVDASAGRRCSCSTGSAPRSRCRTRTRGSRAGRRCRRARAAWRRGSSSRRSRDTSGPPGPTGSPCGPASPRCRRRCRCRRCQASIISRILVSISVALKGRPCTLVSDCASTRNSARTSRESWPRFISGTSSFG